MTAPPLDPTEIETTAPASLGSRLFNVYAAPGELFEELREAQTAHSNWVVPLILSMAMGIVFSVVVFSQPDIVAGLASQQEAALEARVEAGKMTREQADQAMVAMERFSSPGLMMLFGSIGSVVGGVVFFLVVALLLWLLMAVVLKGGVSAAKAFELAGLAGMIFVLGSLLTMTLVLLRGDLQAGLNAALFLERFEPASFTHQLLAAVNAVTLWYLAVLCVGVGRLTSRSFGMAAIWIIGFWAVVRGSIAFASAWWAQVQSGM
jgi:hypothetical protein